MSYRRPKNIREHVVKATLKEHTKSDVGFVPCSRVSSNCKCCKSAIPGNSFQSTVTKEQFKIFSEVNCKSKNLIYLLTCQCGIQYVGQTITPFNIRLNNHRSFNKTKKNCPVNRHLESTGHLFQNIKCQIIEMNEDWDEKTRDAREMFWIHQLCVLEPNGLNERDQMKFKPKKK